MVIRKFALALGLTIAVAGCGGGGGAGEAHPVSEAGVIQGSSEAASGSTAVYTEHGVTHAATPGDSISGFGTVRLLILPNTGSMAAHGNEVMSLSSATVTTSLSDVDVNGVALDPVNDIGAAYSYDSGLVSLFKLSTREELALYDTQTMNGIWYTGAIDTKMAGIVMEPSTKTMIITTADGIEMVDYSTPAAPVKIREIASSEVDAAGGVEIIENFAYDNKLAVSGTNYKMLITGGHGPDIMVLVDISSGTVYRPDAATRALFAVDDYIDAAAVDTSYHVAVLADERAGTTFVDLGKLSLDSVNGTYTLPASAVRRITTYVKFTNLAVDSRQHMVMMGKGYGGTELVVAELKNPADGLGFSREAVITMPDGIDDQGGPVVWSGSLDPHGAGVYVTDAFNPSYPAPAALGVWVNETTTHIAIINLKNVLDGALSGRVYDPTAADPIKDISYFRIP